MRAALRTRLRYLTALVTIPLYVNVRGAIGHRIVFATVWVNVLVFWPMTWYEARAQVSHTEHLLQADRRTGAHTQLR